MALRHLALALALAGCASSTSGAISATGADGWKLVPNTCDSGSHKGFWGVDLYRLDPATDTEVVVQDALVMVRVPGRGYMVRLRNRDCRVLDIDLHTNGVTVNDADALAGHVTLDCQRPESGHVTGTVNFTCY